MNKFNGTPNLKGRPKGAVNKNTAEIRAIFQEIISIELDEIPKLLKDLDPKDRLKTILELSKFVLPTLKATELTATIELEDKPKPILFDFSKLSDKARLELDIMSKLSGIDTKKDLSLLSTSTLKEISTVYDGL
jgi:hypothetical protein